MKKSEWIFVLLAALFAAPVFAQPLSLEDLASADVKAQMYESQMAETSGASVSTVADNGASENAGKAESASSVKEPALEPTMAANEHAGVSTEHPEKPTDKSVGKPEHKRVHVVKHVKKKTS